MVRPSAFAVLRLMTNSNFVGCCTGRSPGLALIRPGRHHSTSRWGSFCRLAGSLGCGRTECHDDVHLESDQIGSKLREAVELIFREMFRDEDVPSLDVTELPQP